MDLLYFPGSIEIAYFERLNTGTQKLSNQNCHWHGGGMMMLDFHGF